MASIAARIAPKTLSTPARQLVLAWLAGSVLLGAVAALFLANRSYYVVMTGPAPGAQRHFAGYMPVTPLAGLPLLTLLGVIALVVLLFVALAGVAATTAQATWLRSAPATGRAVGLWALVTGGIGLAGWGFAATVTFALDFSPAWQLVLAFALGGLPFALGAALLQSSRRVNVAAALLAVALLTAGAVLVATRAPAQPNAFALAFDYLRYLFSGRHVLEPDIDRLG